MNLYVRPRVKTGKTLAPLNKFSNLLTHGWAPAHGLCDIV